MHRRDKQIIFFTIFLVLGFILALQFRSILFVSKQKSEATFSIDKLEARLNDEKKKQLLLNSEVEKLEKWKDDYLKTPEGDVEYSIHYDMLKKELDEMKLMAGLTDVRGSGIIIKLNDSLKRDQGEVMDLIIHDSDMVNIMNELRAAGAEAISINDERIIATSGQVCAGPTIKINNNRYAVPYVVKAIGDPDKLESALAQSEVIKDMKRFYIRVDIQKQNDMVIPAYKNNLDNLISGMEVINDENK